MPRTEKPKKHAIRICSNCGYKFRPDDDGACPVCARFEQLRIDFTVPRPSDLAAHRAEVRDTEVAAPDAWPPTIAEYRAMLAERGLGSAPVGQSRGRVIQTPELTRIRVAPPPGSTSGPDAEELASPVSPRPPGKEASSTSPKKAKKSRKKAKGRKAKAGARRAARARARSLSAAREDEPPTTGPSAARAPAHLPPTAWSGPPGGPLAESVVTVAAESAPTPWQPDRPPMEAAPLRRVEFDWPAEAAGPWLAKVAVVAASALVGALVSILLSAP